MANRPQPPLKPRPLRGVRYFGGKSSTRGRGTGRWIARLLPNPPRWTYVEPFAGMCGVLLAREKRGLEIINDTNGHVVNFWRVLRDRPDELAHAVHNTPQARALYEEAVDLLERHDAGEPADPLRRAWALYTALNYSMLGQPTRSAFISSPIRDMRSHAPAEIAALAHRMRRVTLECVDAVTLVDRVLRASREVVVYADPPYDSTPDQNAAYGQVDDDLGARLLDCLRDAPRGQPGAPGPFVAISGYPGCRYAALERHGWRRHELDVPVLSGAFAAGRRRRAAGSEPVRRQTECLWTNW